MSDQIAELKAEIAKLREVISKLSAENKPFRVFEQSESIDKLSTALAKAQATFVDPEHDGEVDYVDSKGKRTHYTYAKLPAVLKEIRPKLAAVGISFTQIPFVNPVSKKIEVMTQLMCGDQWIRGAFGLDHGQGRPQDGAGIITYERRYSISPMVGISAEADTDGNVGEPENDKKSKDDKAGGQKKTTDKPKQDPNVYKATAEQNIQVKKVFDQRLEELSQEERKRIAGQLLGKPMEKLPELIDLYLEAKQNDLENSK